MRTLRGRQRVILGSLAALLGAVGLALMLMAIEPVSPSAIAPIVEAALPAPAHTASAAPAPREFQSGESDRVVRLELPALREIDEVTRSTVTDDVVDVPYAGVGSLPQPRGVLVLAGHLNHPGGLWGPAARWPSLRKGDLVVLVRARGSKSVLKITSTGSYPGDTLPDTVFARRDSVVLVTCDGPVDPTTHHMSERFAAVAESER